MIRKFIIVFLAASLVNNKLNAEDLDGYAKCRQYETTILVGGRPVIVKSCSDLTPHVKEIQDALAESRDGKYDWRKFEAAYIATRTAKLDKNNRSKIALAFGAGVLITAGFALAKIADYFSGMMDR